MMIEKERRELARRLCVRAMRAYRKEFVLKEDLLNGVDRQRILDEIDKIIEDGHFYIHTPGVLEDIENVYGFQVVGNIHYESWKDVVKFITEY